MLVFEQCDNPDDVFPSFWIWIFFNANLLACYLTTCGGGFPLTHCLFFRELLEHAPTMVVVTSGAIVQINARTLELCSFINLQGEPLTLYIPESVLNKVFLNSYCPFIMSWIRYFLIHTEWMVVGGSVCSSEDHHCWNCWEYIHPKIFEAWYFLW